MGVEGGDAGGDGEMELVEVLVVAAPGKDLAVGGEDDAGDLIDGAGGAVVAGDPLGRGEGDGAGVDGDIDLGVEELARGSERSAVIWMGVFWAAAWAKAPTGRSAESRRVERRRSLAMSGS